MYGKMTTKVRTQDGATETFPLSMGLMQGECLSPSLFSIYINDIDTQIDCIEDMGIHINGVKISILKYADDLVLISQSISGLQKGLNELHRYCHENKLTVNSSKSKLMYFSKTIKKKLPNVHYNINELEWVDSFKYLGITFSRRHTMKCAIEPLCQQARRAQTVLDLHALRHPTLSVEHMLKLFDTLIKPVLTFDCEVWGTGNCDLVDKFYIGFLKKLLGVKPNTNTSMVYAETGCAPMSTYIKKMMIKYWIKIIGNTDNKLIHAAYNEMRNNEHRTNWATKVRDLLFETGFGYIWNDQNVTDSKSFLQQFERRLIDMHIQQCYSDIRDSSRCRTYKEIKKSFGMELYLQDNISRQLRISFTKFRLSSHRLMVERGRWMRPKIEYTERKCTLCDDHDIQDEYHIVMKCPLFHSLRKKYIPEHYYVRPSMYKFVQLMNTPKKKEHFRTMVFIRLVMKEYNEHI